MKNYFFIIMLLLGGGFACAQTTTISKETEIPLHTGANTIVRDCGDNYIVTYVKNADTNKFDIRKRSTSINKAFNFVNEYTPIGKIGYIVRDMYIYKDWCYFCGTKYIPASVLHSLYGPDLIIFDTVGFVGRFNVDSAYNNTCHYYLRQIDEAKSLDRLTVSSVRDLTINAVGQFKQTTDSTCIVELFYSLQLGNWVWKYLVYSPDDLQEVLTDVISTNSLLVTSSRTSLEYQNLFIRQSKLDGIRFITLPDTRLKYSSTPNIHRGRYKRYMLCPKVGDSFEVAYEALDIATNRQKVVLYNMSNPGSMNKLQWLDVLPSNELNDITYSYQTNMTILLCRDVLFPDGLLRFPQWTTYPSSYGDTALHLCCVNLQSIDADNSSNFLTSGRNLSTEHLDHLVQHCNYAFTDSTRCLDEKKYKDCYIFRDIISPEKEYRLWIEKNNKGFSWTKYPCERYLINSSTKCVRECNLNHQ